MRLQGFRDSPEAFGSSYEEEILLSDDQLAQKYSAVLRPTNDTFVLGAFDRAGRIVGIAGFRREARLKNRHKGVIWGMYVNPGSRGKGAGRALLTGILDHIRSVSDLRQVNLAVVSDNMPAKRLYTSMGFVTYGVEKEALRLDNRFFDEDLMVLRLV